MNQLSFTQTVNLELFDSPHTIIFYTVQLGYSNPCDVYYIFGRTSGC